MTATSITNTAGQRLFSCDRCGRVTPWGPKWLWFGSYIDDPATVPTYCGEPDCTETKRTPIPPRLVK